MRDWERNPNWREQDLYFDFSQARSAIKLDESGRDGHGLSHMLKSVDFVVEWSNQYWLIEIKDPDNGAIPEAQREKQLNKFSKELKSGELISTHLFPKLRDSLIYLSMDKGVPNLPLKYIVLIGMNCLEPPELSALKAKLKNTNWLSGPKRGWNKSFDIQCLNIKQWNRLLTNCPVQRISNN